MPNDDPVNQTPFQGFQRPESNFFRLPNYWTNLTARMKTWAEHKIVEYVLRHTWGYSEYGIKRRITLDEFQNGRKRKDGTRIDHGTGLGKKAVIDGIRQAIADGFLTEDSDYSDRARIRKLYSLRMRAGQETVLNEHDALANEASRPSDGLDASPPSLGFDQATSDVRSSNPRVSASNRGGSV